MKYTLIVVLVAVFALGLGATHSPFEPQQATPTPRPVPTFGLELQWDWVDNQLFFVVAHGPKVIIPDEPECTAEPSPTVSCKIEAQIETTNLYGTDTENGASRPVPIFYEEMTVKEVLGTYQLEAVITWEFDTAGDKSGIWKLLGVTGPMH